MPRLIVALVFAALVPAIVRATHTAHHPTTYFEGPGKCSLPFTVTPDGKPVITATVHGKSLTLFLDTGATTILDLHVARKIGLAPVETSQPGFGLTGLAGNRWVATANLQIGKIKITQIPVSCLDLSALRNLNKSKGLPPLDGLIGSDLLAILRARIDYAHHRLTIERPTAKQLQNSFSHSN